MGWKSEGVGGFPVVEIMVFNFFKILTHHYPSLGYRWNPEDFDPLKTFRWQPKVSITHGPHHHLLVQSCLVHSSTLSVYSVTNDPLIHVGVNKLPPPDDRPRMSQLMEAWLGRGHEQQKKSENPARTILGGFFDETSVIPIYPTLS